MNKWTINGQEIEVGNLTILKGLEYEWFNIAREIDSYFNEKNSIVEFQINDVRVNKGDWECLFFSYDNQFSLDKISLKSPLKRWQKEIMDYLYLTPSIIKLEEIWEELKEELSIFNISQTKYDKLPIKWELEDIDNQLILERLFIKEKRKLSPSSFKLILLNIILEEKVSKKRIIILEAPELFTNDEEYNELLQIVHNLIRKGNILLLVSSKSIIESNRNYLLNGRIINSIVIDELFREIKEEVPFLLIEEDFLFVKDKILFAVDNQLIAPFEMNNLANYSQVITIAFLICKKIGINTNIDLTRCSDNIRMYLTSNGYGNKMGV